MSDDITEDDVAAVLGAVETMRAGRWTIAEPVFVDEMDETPLTHPEDEPIRTVGALLEVPPPGSVPDVPREEVECFLRAMATASRARGLEMEVELDGTHCGMIKDGKLSKSLEMGLLEAW